jgi:hypothetical protein
MYYILEPEVAGGLGELTVMDSSKHPPEVTKLHYEFEGWLGDEILETFPCYIVTSEVRDALEKQPVTGCSFEEATISILPVFREIYSDRYLPSFRWLKVHGTAGKDDIGLAADGRIVVSDAALAVLRRFRLDHCEVSEWQG